MEMSFERNIASREWYLYGKKVWQNPRRNKELEAKKEGNKEATKSIQMQLLGQSKERINLFLLLSSYPKRDFEVYNSFLTTVEELKRRFFLHKTNHPQFHQEGLKYPLLLRLRYPRKNQRFNCEELTSVDTPQNEVKVEEELGQDYNSEDEDIVFIDDDSESGSDYST